MYTTPRHTPCQDNPLAAALHALHTALDGTDYSLERIISPTPGRYGVQWRHNWSDTSFILFTRKIHNSFLGLIEYLKAANEELKMDILSTELFPYIEGSMLAGKGQVAMTIKDVIKEDVGSQRGEETKVIMRFVEKDKGLILNKTNAKMLVELYGRETNEWRGKRIYLYAKFGKWFGEERYGVRISDKIPPPKNGQSAPAQAAPPPPQEKAEPFDPVTAVRVDSAHFVQICLDTIERYDRAIQVSSVMKMFNYDDVPPTANEREDLYQKIAQYAVLRTTGLKKGQALTVINGALSDEPITDVAQIPFDMSEGEAVAE